ncbi:MAG: sugar transferase [Rubricoccaceae bacterium]|nr:sugar transferase [Rubricoccaceae bacterium]
MSRRIELLALLLSDALALSTAYWVFSGASSRWGWFEGGLIETLSGTAVWGVLCLSWLILFFFAGMYQERFAGSRFDEFVTLLKVVTVGSLLLFFGLFIDRMATESARLAIALYWGLAVVAVSGGRFLVRAVQKSLILGGKGLHKAVVVGWSDQVQELYREVARYPAAGLQIVGAVRLPRTLQVPAKSVVGGEALPESPLTTEGDALPTDDLELAPWMDGNGVIMQQLSELPTLIDRLDVQDVLIALGPGDHKHLDEVLRVCDGKAVSLKLVPDFYAAIGGMARTEHMYGLPLIEVFPEPIPAWEKSTKRLIDVTVSLFILALGAPLWLLISLGVRLSSRGPAIYRQTRVGQLGQEFTMFKYRTMFEGAEKKTGPVWATKGDNRVTPFGKLLRKLRLDEVPQLWNVLKGQMSLVGPRPERPFFVDQHTDGIPLYSRRHRVKPGITGLAQVKWRYDGDLDDVRQKLKYDLFYIENMSLRMDFKIMLQTIKTALLGKGH